MSGRGLRFWDKTSVAAGAILPPFQKKPSVEHLNRRVKHHSCCSPESKSRFDQWLSGSISFDFLPPNDQAFIKRRGNVD